MTKVDARLHFLRPSPLTLRALGVFCAGLLLAEVNILSSRNYHQVDASQDQRYSLSEATKTFVTKISEPIEITLLLGQGDPLLDEVRHVLSAYRALSSHLLVRHIDPDRDTAKFLALKEKYDIELEQGPDETAVAEAALLLRKGERTWFIRGGQLSEIDPDGNVRLRIEARLTEGLAQVSTTERSHSCFITGHGERSVDDAAAEGLLELARRLEKSNIEVERVPLDVPNPDEVLQKCDAIVVVGPERPWPEKHAHALRHRVEAGASVALYLDPLVDDRGTLAASGLAPVLSELGVAETRTFVLETDPAYRLPGGIGEAFLAQPKSHPTTRGLSTEESRTDARVALAAVQALSPVSSANTSIVLQSSARAATLSDLNRPEESNSAGVPLALAVAGQKSREGENPQRWLVVGSSNVLENPSFRDPALFGNRVFAESAFAWLLESRALVTVPDKPPLPAGLSLTEESLQQLLRYVLIYMPLAAALAGGYVLWRRLRREEESRSDEARVEEVSR